MRALVTGASGFVGRHLVAHLTAVGDEVAASSTEITDPAALLAEFRRCRPETVYHLAALADVGASWANPAATLRVNVEGTFNVLEAARRADASRAVAVTSADVYGRVAPGGLPVTECAPMRPVTPYGASKAAAEMVCIQAGASAGRPAHAHASPSAPSADNHASPDAPSAPSADNHASPDAFDAPGGGFGVIRARAFNHLGPGQSDRFVASALAARIAANERTGAAAVRAGNLEARRDFTDVRDVVRAYRMLAVAGEPGEAYNVCSGKARSVRDLAERLLARARHPMRMRADSALMRPVDVPELTGDPSKLRAATGWRPEIPLQQTLDDLLDHWRCETARMAAASPSRLPA